MHHPKYHPHHQESQTTPSQAGPFLSLLYNWPWGVPSLQTERTGLAQGNENPAASSVPADGASLSTPPSHAWRSAGPGTSATGTACPASRMRHRGITYRAPDVGRVVNAGRPLIGAITVGGDKPVLLGVRGAAVHLVFPAGLRRTFYP